jgi:hypothetical protein
MFCAWEESAAVNVPAVVTGELDTEKIDGSESPTLVTEPCPLLLKVFQSVEDNHPFVVALACVIERVLSADKSPPPLSGAVVLMVRDVPTLLLKVVQSAAVNKPLADAEAEGRLSVTVPPNDTGEPLILTSVPVVPVVILIEEFDGASVDQ